MSPLPPFQAFLDEHRTPVMGFLRAMVGPDEADDCFQETFIAALRAYHRLDGASPRAWVMTIARRKAIDHHRAAGRRPEPRAEVPERRAAEPPERDEDLWRAVGELPEKQRGAVAMRYGADLGYGEIAAALECSPEAARRSVHEGLNRLRKTIPTPGGGE